MKTVIITVDNHSHQGQRVERGTELTVPNPTAEWLIARHKAQEKPSAKPPIQKPIDKPKEDVKP